MPKKEKKSELFSVFHAPMRDCNYKALEMTHRLIVALVVLCVGSSQLGMKNGMFHHWKCHAIHVVVILLILQPVISVFSLQ
jgi:hypothetical protein